MEGFRCVLATEEDLLPSLLSILTEHTEEQEYKEALEGVEESKEDLESKGGFCNCQCSKHPGQSKEKHDTCDADEDLDGSLHINLLFSLQSQRGAQGVADEN